MFIFNCFFSPNKVGELTEQMVGYNLITKQTPEDGVLVNKVNELFSFSLLFQAVKSVKCKRR